MIELIPSEHDDSGFLSLAQRIVNGALASLQMLEAYLVHIDNWFDHMWLAWWSRKGEELRIPTFTPNRVQSERHFVWDLEKSAWISTDLTMPLHVRQPGRPWLAQPLDRFSTRAAFVWYSGNTVANGIGSVMLYISGAESYAWYASFVRTEHWKVKVEFRITRRELESFEQRGRQMEVALLGPS
ncbi:MAG TPA: hypothetical protein VE988_24990 [Gemmataceae bacterium]|nr:hypothetical protein [Gemmataceae bacterium]